MHQNASLRSAKAETEPAGVDESLEQVLKEMQQVQKAFSTNATASPLEPKQATPRLSSEMASLDSAPLGNAVNSRCCDSSDFSQKTGTSRPATSDVPCRPPSQRGSSRQGGRVSADNDDEEAEIELLRGRGNAVARLQHPLGAEAYVDLNRSIFLGWRLSDGRFADATKMPPLWPSALAGQGAPSWRLTLLDDSNNEPSVVLVRGGEPGSPWLVRRVLSAGKNWLREDVYVENTSDVEGTFSVTSGQVPEGIISAKATALLPAAVLAAPEMTPRRLLASGAANPSSSPVLLTPGSTWSGTQWWTSDSPTPATMH